MSRPGTHEQRLLSQANAYIETVANNINERLALIELTAAIHSGADIHEYWASFNINGDYKIDDALYLNNIIEQEEIPYSMAISSLSREPLTIEDQRKNGVFYTDYRLSSFMADRCKKELKEYSRVADFAAGTGMLLIGVAEKYKENYGESFDEWLKNCVYAYDLSEIALRGALAAFLSMTSNIGALVAMRNNWCCMDSLLERSDEKFDIVVGNPPWGKIKISRHTFMQQNGVQRVYGSEYTEIKEESYATEKRALAEYSRTLKKNYLLLGDAEPDMYMAFLELAVNSLKKSGALFFLVPAGLIRSKGTKNLREFLLKTGSSVKYNLFSNQANYFAIDSRFKFLLVEFVAGSDDSSSVLSKFYYADCKTDEDNKICSEEVELDTELLRNIRPDLTVPEVASQSELELFLKIYRNGCQWGNVDGIWNASVLREVDMTNDRDKFKKICDGKMVPVIEGRMVQNHRFGTKSYVSGSGRSAKWVPSANGCNPQFFCDVDLLSEEVKRRITTIRAGYCDIAGQTNERAMMSSVIPANVVCGNKVPTIIFPNDTSGDMIYLWIGVTNSFVFDWMIRRVISTTINYFLLFSIPMPDIEIKSSAAQEIITKTKQLSLMKEDFYTNVYVDEIRADIDVAVARGYGLSLKDMELIMNDFPLLDRKQPSLNGERKSSVTKDLLLSRFCRSAGIKKNIYDIRAMHAKLAGARAYIPTEMTCLTEN